MRVAGDDWFKMSSVRWLSLLVLMAIALFSLLFYTEQQTGQSELPDSGFLLESINLEEKLDDLDKVVFSHEDNFFALWHDEDSEQWRIARNAAPGNNDFPADINKISDFLTQLSLLVKKEPKTTRPELHFLLGLNNPEDGGEGTRLILQAKDKSLILNMILGNSANTGEGFYARFNEEVQTWLVSPELENFSLVPGSWMHHPLLNLAADRVMEVSILENYETYRFFRSSSDEPLQTELPEGTEIDEELEPIDKATALEDLDFEDALLISETTFTFVAERQAAIKTFNGVVLNVGIQLDSPKGTLMSLFASADQELADSSTEEEVVSLNQLFERRLFVIDIDTVDRFSAEYMVSLKEDEFENVPQLDLSP